MGNSSNNNSNTNRIKHQLAHLRLVLAWLLQCFAFGTEHLVCFFSESCEMFPAKQSDGISVLKERSFSSLLLDND